MVLTWQTRQYIEEEIRRWLLSFPGLAIVSSSSVRSVTSVGWRTMLRSFLKRPARVLLLLTSIDWSIDYVQLLHKDICPVIFVRSSAYPILLCSWPHPFAAAKFWGGWGSGWCDGCSFKLFPMYTHLNESLIDKNTLVHRVMLLNVGDQPSINKNTKRPDRLGNCVSFMLYYMFPASWCFSFPGTLLEVIPEQLGGLCDPF